MLGLSLHWSMTEYRCLCRGPDNDYCVCPNFPGEILEGGEFQDLGKPERRELGLRKEDERSRDW